MRNATLTQNTMQMTMSIWQEAWLQLQSKAGIVFFQDIVTGEGLGVEGYEDGDWQKTVSSADHNEYLGNQVFRWLWICSW